MADGQPADWVGAIRRLVDLWLALQLTVGITLSAGLSAVADYSTRLNLLVLAVVPLLLAVGVSFSGRSPETEPLWVGGFAVLGTAFGIALLSHFLDIPAPEHVAYLLAVVVVVGAYTVHRALTFLAQSTTP